jgi:cytoskeletal protein CcmA (bactofilin family)
MDSRVIQIMANGAFKGSADIDIAEIHGQFDGNLTVRDKLVIFSQGKVNGTIRYGKVIIEEGGQLSGDVLFGAKTTQAVNTSASTHKPEVQLAQ